MLLCFFLEENIKSEDKLINDVKIKGTAGIELMQAKHALEICTLKKEHIELIDMLSAKQCANFSSAQEKHSAALAANQQKYKEEIEYLHDSRKRVKKDLALTKQKYNNMILQRTQRMCSIPKNEMKHRISACKVVLGICIIAVIFLFFLMVVN
jgi:hypothetical protein